MLKFWPRCETDSKITVGVACQHDTWACGVGFIARIADASDPWDVGRCGTAANDGVGVVFPESGGELQCHLGYNERAKSLRWGPYLAHSSVRHCSDRSSKRRIEH